MPKIEEIDENFAVKSFEKKKDIVFYNLDNEVFRIYGIKYIDGKYRRMPEDVAKTVSEGVLGSHARTAGGRVRFKTDSPYIAIYAKFNGVGKMPHFALTGSVGFDLYARNEGEEIYKGTFVPPFDVENEYGSVIDVKTEKNDEMIEYTINFPLYSGINELLIGVGKEAKLTKADNYKYEQPIVFYGSSITQGGCASRPGMSYESIVSRELDTNFVNLGFSGSAKAEKEFAKYISTLDMSVFVYDYDHNADSVSYLQATHERMFKTIREAQPNLPIVIMSAPVYKPSEDFIKRREIIEQTYNNALNNNDKNVYFISGKELMKEVKNDGRVDSCHPTDAGFLSMAHAVSKVLKKIL